MMEEKQLNFNQPLLSVRRGTSITAPPEKERNTDNPHRSLPPLPYYKSELKSGPIRNPGVVPFKWEQMPGRPKGENKAQNNTLDCTPLVPKLPPGRTPNHLRKQTDEALRDPPTSSSRYRAEYDNLHSSENSSLDKVISEVEESEKEIEGKYASSSDDENVSYLDARETLSRTESFFNCSVSGVSGLDGPESRGAFLDSQTRDFMMGRFLPAAKAVASETPAFASRRRPAAREQEKPVVKTVKLKNQSPSYDTFLDPLYLSINGDELDEEDDSDEAEDLSLKLCGLMPRFCMLNPIPAMRDHVPVISSARSVRTRPAYAAFGSDNKHKDAIINRGELKRTTNRYTPTEESLMNGLLGRNGMAKEKNALPQLFLNREKQFLGLPGEPRDFGSCKPNLPKNKLDSDEHDTENASSLVNRPADEKTLYVDFESMVESRHSHSSSPESRGRNPSVDSLQDIKSLCCAEEKAISRLESPETTTCTALSTSEKFFEDVSEGIKNMQKDVQDVSIVDAQHPPTADVKTMKQSKMFGSSLGLTPLLPKSPSESWLSRTLPSMPSRNPSSKSYLANHAYRHSPVDPKREELLKSSGAQNMLFLSAGELAPISEN